MSDKKLKKWNKPVLVIFKNPLTPEVEGKLPASLERTFPLAPSAGGIS
ncbi:hypothetical protein [Francisella tularensis]|nr:hypothetical protein [Francisella tularensis]AHH46448.1 hypothetical protein X557_05385 [Francisella tularensis subsp. holarctica PHIT-FT049]MBK2077894.1 hypothetical protein [Francisella tularensis subsp. mediasiatica]MBK2101914.1 hypothetical protein [Francisella tularensis subsp. mediasiatica]MBK2103893.1 hypothetical protein [Francisella tularensis subsp. mediasiatica]MDN9003250.1 hypothetical protein [Francisella tularensis subsp. mediasiatica]